MNCFQMVQSSWQCSALKKDLAEVVPTNSKVVLSPKRKFDRGLVPSTSRYRSRSWLKENIRLPHLSSPIEYKKIVDGKMHQLCSTGTS